MEKYVEKECGKHGLVNFVLEGRGYYRCTKCRSFQVQKRRENLKKKAVIYKGGKCERCGYDKCIAALDFHHLDPNKKDFGIAANGYTRSWEKMKDELDKCVMICANCHREKHFLEDQEIKEKNLPKHDIKEKSFKHGTPSSYNYHKCRCEICRLAHNERMREYSKKTK